MKRNLSLMLLLPLLLGMASCKSTSKLDYQTLAKASIKLGVDIGLHDNHKLYLNAADWIGTPYMDNGNEQSGTDCSGFTQRLYRLTYHMRLSRTVAKQKSVDSRRLLTRHELREGDLVFFGTGVNSRKATHVGVYLKEGKFIHASTGSGVIVSSLDEPYYKERWICGGRVR